MNFTKDYIELCKSDKIQKLKYWKDTDGVIDWLLLRTGDWLYLPPREEMWCIDETKNFGIANIWLPLSHQLDEEIIKILAEWSKDGEDLGYNIGVSLHEGCVSAWEISVENRDCEKSELDSNPLIAKIKLLLQLLKEQDDNRK